MIYFLKLCVNIVLSAKKTKFKKFFKFRKCRRLHFVKQLKYGNSGLLILRPFTLTAKKTVKIILLLKKATKRATYTQRAYWFNCFPHFPVTRKSPNSRMGSGKGKPKKWVTQVKPGLIFFELKNLRNGRAAFFIHKVQRRLKTQTTILFQNIFLINYPFYIAKKNRLAPFY